MRLNRSTLQEFGHLAASADEDLATPALLLPRLEFPAFRGASTLTRLDEMGAELRERFSRAGLESRDDVSPLVTEANRYLFDELGFHGNRTRYEDPRNSFLDHVIARRTGIPITLAVVYIEVTRRAGLPVRGVSFPGRFLLRCPASHGTLGLHDLILDPFNRGARLSHTDCQRLLLEYVEDEPSFEPSLLDPATKPQILTRMLMNLKNVYVHMRSFRQARDVTDLLLTVSPSALIELRDRGLLSYNLNDFPAALRDLQQYLHLSSQSPPSEESATDREQLWDHVKTLRRRVADLN